MTAAEAGTNRPGIISAAQAAALIGVTPERVRQLVSMGYISRPARNEYALVAVVQGAIRFQEDRLRRIEAGAAMSGLRLARQEEIEQRLAERRRGLVDREEANAAMDIVVAEVEAGVAGLADECTTDAAERRAIAGKLAEALGRIRGARDRAKLRLAGEVGADND